MSGTVCGSSAFCVISGASRGLGLEIASQLSENLGKSCFVLLARNQQLLEKNCQQFRQKYPGNEYNFMVIDNSDAGYEDYKQIFTKFFTPVVKQMVSSFVLVNNSGSTGDIKLPLAEIKSKQYLDSYFHSNLSSVLLLTNAFLESCNDSNKTKLVINISSGAATTAFEGMGVYCTGKAARKMYFEVLALEKPDVKVLSYSPGPLDTDMLREVMASAKGNSAVKEIIEKRMITVEVTTKKLISVLRENKFKSGDHVSYY